MGCSGNARSNSDFQGSGCLLLVIPNTCGICIWSPRLDDMGNTVRGVDFCQEFAKRTENKYHVFNTPMTQSNLEDSNVILQHFITSACNNDLEGVKKYLPSIDINNADYDGRTALHLAAAECHYDIVKYLLDKGAQKDVKDRWGNTPYSEAMKCGENKELLELLIL